MPRCVAVLAMLILAILTTGSPVSAQKLDDQEWRIRGVVRDIQGDRITIRTENDRTVVVDASQVGRKTRDQLKVGDRVSVVGEFTDRQRMTARAMRELGDNPQQRDGDWERIHGRVQGVDGSTLRLRTDQGRTVTVDMSNVGSNIRGALTEGEGVTVIGHEWLGPNRLRAEYIQQDSSDPARQAAAANREQKDKGRDRERDRISGSVASISGNTMDLRTDDGRSIAVNVSDIDLDLRRSLRTGDKITVIGRSQGDSRFRADRIQRGEPAASNR